MGGYIAIGSEQSAIAPASVIAIDRTVAKIGRSMKKRENTEGARGLRSGKRERRGVIGRDALERASAASEFGGGVWAGRAAGRDAGAGDAAAPGRWESSGCPSAAAVLRAPDSATGIPAAATDGRGGVGAAGFDSPCGARGWGGSGPW